jgi:hypothetical protein
LYFNEARSSKCHVNRHIGAAKCSAAEVFSLDGKVLNPCCLVY